MIINRLSGKVGEGVITNHEKMLTAQGYEIISVNLLMLEDYDLLAKNPVLKDGETVFCTNENSLDFLVKNIHNRGNKAAICLIEYSSEHKRFPTLDLVIDKGENLFSMNSDDVIFFNSYE